jgi:hypothetical protein
VETEVARPITGSILTRRLADDTLVEMQDVQRRQAAKFATTEQRRAARDIRPSLSFWSGSMVDA